MASARAAKAREGTAGALKRAAFCDEGRKEQDDEDDVLLHQNGHQLSIVNAQRSANPGDTRQEDPWSTRGPEH